MSDPPMLSSAAKDVLNKVRLVVPPLLDKFHKGQLGRIAVIGGSKNYTGAPFFSANASARLGADLSYVICEPSAATVIKTYSPNLMVSPLMRESDTPYPQDPAPPTAEHVASTIVEMMARLHVLVIGPGLGRDVLMQATCKQVITAARERRIPIVLDADALQIVNAEPGFVKGWKEVVLTPNVVEFARLAEAVGVDVKGVKKDEACAKVSEALGGVCIIQKGDVDYISAGGKTMVCDLEGGKKRSGGQGDTLTGSVGTFLCWRRAYLDKLWETEGELGEDELVMLSAWGGAAITRECSRLAFGERGRSLQASDVGDMVPRAFEGLLGEKQVPEEQEGQASKL